MLHRRRSVKERQALRRTLELDHVRGGERALDIREALAVHPLLHHLNTLRVPRCLGSAPCFLIPS